MNSVLECNDMTAPPPHEIERAVPLATGATIDIATIAAEGGEMPAELRSWVEAAANAEHGGPAVWMAFQGAQVHWCAARCAILAPAERLLALKSAVIQAASCEAELRAIETEIASAWPELEADSPLSFDFNEASVGRREVLRTRLQRVIQWKIRLARIAPYVHSPLVHPPTLASQVAERMRERLRMLARHEVASSQLDLFGDVYEACGQRASEFMLARTGHHLEWVIIILLAAQLALWGFEYLVAYTK